MSYKTVSSKVFIFTRGGTVHRCHSVRTSVRGSRFVTISVTLQQEKINLLCSVSFHLFRTDSSANYIFFHLDVKILIINTNTIITLLYNAYLFRFHCVYTNKSRPLSNDY